MEPTKQSQANPGGNSERKIIFSAPGTQMGMTTPAQQKQPEQVLPQSAKKLPPINMPKNASVYGVSSITDDKKGGVIATPPPPPPQPVIKPIAPVKPIITQHMPMPGEPKITPHLSQPGQTGSNPAFRSFAHDIKSNVEDKGVSMAQIVMEEERRKQAAGATDADFVEADKKSKVLRTVLVTIGLIAVIGGAVALYITFQASLPVNQIATPQDYSPIRAQKVAAIELRDGFKNTLLEAARGVSATFVQPETFVELRLLETVGETSLEVDLYRLVEIMEARIPPELLRAAGDEYILGVYGKGSENVPFLMLTVDSFDNGYSGMSAWEETLLGDIGGLFIDQEKLSVIIASSTPSLFSDKVYYNKDARAVFGKDGKPLLIWAIVDRRQIVITKDGETLNALMNRITLENITR